jgi:hypothetical protein
MSQASPLSVRAQERTGDYKVYRRSSRGALKCSGSLATASLSIRARKSSHLETSRRLHSRTLPNWTYQGKTE